MKNSKFNLYASVILELSIDKALDYGIPDEYLSILKPGMRVEVPLRGRLQEGYVISIKREPNFTPVKPISRILSSVELITPDLFKLALWMASLEYGTYRRILDSVRVVVFLGTPHRAASRVLLEDQVAKLVVQASPQSLPVWRLADNVKSLTQAVIWINTRFEKTNLSSLLEIISVISTEDAATAVRLYPT